MYKITLDDGTEIIANLNMNTWESDVEIDEKVFRENTDNVSYETPDGEIIELGECNYIIMGYQGGDKFMFGLMPLTDEEKAQKAIELNTANIDYISAMTGIDI